MMEQHTYTTIAANTIDETGLAAAAGLRLLGYSARETAGSAATLNLEHGVANSSPILAGINLAANASDLKWFGPQGIPADAGIWVERLTGTSQVILITTVL